MEWSIVLYQASTGRPVVADFINSLDATSYAKTLRQIELLQRYGTELGMPHVKPLGDGLLELRVRGKREVRIFYVYATQKRAILLHGFVKKTQATPRKELMIARKRQQEFKVL